MAKLLFSEIANAVGGYISEVDWNTHVSSFSIDSRTIEPEDLFFAIIGEKHDGHQFLSEAFEKEAIGAVVREDTNIPEIKGAKNLLKVRDTHQALKDLACYVRQSYAPKIIGITGSCGKTSTKDMAYQLLKGHFKIKRTEGNYNNLYGLPLSLLCLEEDDEIFVGEMAMSGPGEIEELAKIAQPNIGMITNIHPVHTEFFDAMKDLAQAKKELLDGLVGERIAILNADNKLVEEIASDFSGERITFGIDKKADIMATDIKPLGVEGTSFMLHYKGQSYPVKLNLIGLYNIYNLLAALGACQALGLDLKELTGKFPQLVLNQMRSRVAKLNGNVTLIDDSYNSNPRAIEMVLDYMKQLEGYKRKIVVSGDMLELGSLAHSHHIELGKLIVKTGIDMLLGIGELSKLTVASAIKEGMDALNALHFTDSETAGKYLAPLLQSGDLILVKGSRAMHTDKVVKAIKNHMKQKV